MAHPNAHTPTSRRHNAPISKFNNVHPKAAPIIWKLARHIYAITRPTYPGVWIGRGWDPGSSEHGTGRALDIIVSTKIGRIATASERTAGDTVAAWLVRHAKTLHIRHIIWNKRIYRTRYGTWGPLPNRSRSSSVSDWHQDHIHVWLQDNTGEVPDQPLDATTTPTPKNTVQRGDHFPLLYNVKDHPRGSSHGARVKTLQAGLNRVFPAYRHAVSPARLLTVDGWFGRHTADWIKEFQRRVSLTPDGIVGPNTRSALRAHGIAL